MLSEKEKNYFFEYFKNIFYLDDKATIEEIYSDIEKEEVRKNRDRLLLEAEKRAIENAQKAVRKIKNTTIDQLAQQFGEDSASSDRTFGKDLLTEIETDLKK